MSKILPTLSEVMSEAESDSFSGWCFNCGDWTHDNCEPDARNYECPECERKTVFAAEEILISQLFIYDEPEEEDDE